MTSTKFWGFLLVVVGLFSSVFAGKFTGELGLYVTTAYGLYVGGNTLITRAALANGKDPNGKVNE